MSDLLNIYKWRSASDEEIDLMKRWYRDGVSFQKSAYILAASIYIVPCAFLLIVNAIFLKITFIYVSVLFVVVSTVMMIVPLYHRANKYSSLLSKGLFKVQHGRIVNKNPEHYAFDIKDYSVLFEDDSNNTQSVPVVTEDYLKATEGACLIVKWENHFQDGKFGIVMCDNNDNGWRRASVSEARIVENHASNIYRKKRNDMIVGLVFMLVCIGVSLIAVFFNEYSGMSVCIIGSIVSVCFLVNLLKLQKLPKQIAVGNYEVMTGRIIDKSAVGSGEKSAYNLIFENEYGYTLKLTLNKKEYDITSQDGCLVYKTKSVGFIKKEDIYCLNYDPLYNDEVN